MPENVQTAVDIEELRALVADALELPVTEVTDDAHFSEDLDVDSLMALEITVGLEKCYGITLEDSDFKHITSLAQVHSLVQSKLGVGSSV